MTTRTLSGARLARFLRRHPRLAVALKRTRLTINTATLRVRKRKLSQRVAALAGHYVGVKEYPAGSNMTMFGKWYGWNGVAWCAIFVSFVLSHAGRPFKMAWVPGIVTAARNGDGGLTVIPASQVNAALAAGHPVLACYDWKGDGVADHVEFATHVDDGMVHAIGGNTGDADWSNGGEVLRVERPVSLVQAFVKVS